jgi:hypothetical protein
VEDHYKAGLYSAHKVGGVMSVDDFVMKIAYLLPRRLVYFCGIRIVAHATTGEYGNTIVPELSAMDAIGRWGTK